MRAAFPLRLRAPSADWHELIPAACVSAVVIQRPSSPLLPKEIRASAYVCPWLRRMRRAPQTSPLKILTSTRSMFFMRRNDDGSPGQDRSSHFYLPVSETKSKRHGGEVSAFKNTRGQFPLCKCQ